MEQYLKPPSEVPNEARKIHCGYFNDKEFLQELWVPIMQAQGITKKQQENILKYCFEIIVYELGGSIQWFQYIGPDEEVISQIDFIRGELFLRYFKEHEYNFDYLTKYHKTHDAIYTILNRYERNLNKALDVLLKSNSPYYDFVKEKCHYCTSTKINDFPNYHEYCLDNEKMQTILKIAYFPDHSTDKIQVKEF